MLVSSGNPHVNDHLRQMLARAREDRGLTQRQLCKKLSRKATYIQKIESGETKKLDVAEVMSILDTLELDRNEFFREFLAGIALDL